MINRQQVYVKKVPEIPRFLKFCIIGASGVLINTGILILLYQYVHLPLIASSLYAICIAMLSNFILNDLWTFSDVNGMVTSTHERAMSFLVICSAGALINMLILNILTLYGVWYVLSNLIGIGAATLWNYFANKRVTWGT